MIKILISPLQCRNDTLRVFWPCSVKKKKENVQNSDNNNNGKKRRNSEAVGDPEIKI